MPQPGVAVDALAAAQRLSLTVQQATLADAERPRAEAFKVPHRHLAGTFPNVHARLQRTEVGRHALLFTWPDRDPKPCRSR